MTYASVADLHSHTYYSDGSDSPRKLVEYAKKARLTALAVTDHDILDGLPEAAEAAREYGIELLQGIEMSAALGDADVHVLGLLIELNHAPLLEFLAVQRERRLQRMHGMVAKLQGIGLAITVDDVMACAGKGTMGRPHVAEALFRRGHVASLREAFDRFLGGKGPAFVPGSTTEPSVVIDLIRQAGGIPVLAHPVYLKNDALIEQFRDQGLVGLEVYHSSHDAGTVRRYEQLAKRLGLLPTGGSDYHGGSKEGVPVGTAVVPYVFVEALKKWKAERASTTRA